MVDIVSTEIEEQKAQVPDEEKLVRTSPRRQVILSGMHFLSTILEMSSIPGSNERQGRENFHYNSYYNSCDSSLSRALGVSSLFINYTCCALCHS